MMCLICRIPYLLALSLFFGHLVDGNPIWMINGLLMDVLMVDDDVLYVGGGFLMSWMNLDGSWSDLEEDRIMEFSAL